LALWEALLTKSVSLFPKQATSSLEWRGVKFNLNRHNSGEFYEEWLEARPFYQAWFVKQRPAIFSPQAKLSFADRFINFSPESEQQIILGRRPPMINCTALARDAVTLFCGQIPRSDFWLACWKRWNRICKSATMRSVGYQQSDE
jgi:hypothetical protein